LSWALYLIIVVVIIWICLVLMVPHYSSNLTTNSCLAQIRLLVLFDRQSRFFTAFVRLTVSGVIPVFTAVKLALIITTKTMPPTIAVQ